MTKVTRMALRREDWRRINKASSISNPEKFRAAVDQVVRDRMAKAWNEGFKAGHKVADDFHTDADAKDAHNPYRGNA